MQRGTLCLHCGFEGGNYRQILFMAVFSIFMRTQRVSWYPVEVQAGSEWLSLGYLEWIKATLNKSHVSVVSRLARLRANRSWLRGALNVLRGVA